MTQHTELIKEYRPTMHADVLHLWAKEARDALEAQAREIEALKRDGPEVIIGFNTEGEPLRGPMRKALELAESAARAEANYADSLRKDATLVAARERERCAQVCEGFKQGNSATYIDDDWADMCAAAIRALNTEEKEMEWKIEYDNDTGPFDEGFEEWWTVTNGERSFQCKTEDDALWLKAILEKVQ